MSPTSGKLFISYIGNEVVKRPSLPMLSSWLHEQGLKARKDPQITNQFDARKYNPIQY